MQYRPDRLAHELRNEISVIVSREVKDPRVGFATITNVRVSPDLRHARVSVSVFGSPEQQKATLAALHRATGFIRRQLSGRVKLRHCPDLEFNLDDSMEYGAKMDGLLAEVRQELQTTEPQVEAIDEAVPPNSPKVLDENDPTSSEERSDI
jgi:ribosome-binding factor A